MVINARQETIKVGINIEIDKKPFVSYRYAARRLGVCHKTIRNRCLSDKWLSYKIIVIDEVAAGEKRCTKCGGVKLIGEFYKRTISPDGVSPSCKKCMDNERKRHKGENPEKIKKQKRESYYRNIDTTKNYLEENSIKIKRKKKEYDRTHKEEKNIRRRKRLANDFAYRLNCNMGTNIWKALKRRKDGGCWETFVDYNLKELIVHLESQFSLGMTWENYGYGEDKWNIDHIIASSKFNITSNTCQAFKDCWALNNLQPLWQTRNFEKGDKPMEPKYLIK